MRVSLPTTILLLAIAPAGWLATATEASAQGMCQVSDDWIDCGQGQCMDQEACMMPAADCGPCGPRWSFAAEAIALHRTPTRDRPLFTNFQTPLETDPLGARDLNSSVGLGYDLSAIRHGLCGHDVEVRYFQVDGFSAQATLPDLSYMVTDANQTGFLVSNGHASYTSAIYNGEVNVRKQWSDWFTILCGFRMAQINEHYLASGTEAYIPTRTDWVNTNTYNHLFGYQIGADMVAYDMGGPLTIKALCRAGVFDNFAHQNYRRVSVEGETVIVNDAYSDHRDQASFLGEAGVVATYALTQRLAFRASAEAIWVTGLALAPEQLVGVNTRTGADVINTSGAVFYYGGGLGLEYRF